MFNIYYINYAKAYEIAMLFDNKLLESIEKEREIHGIGNLLAEADMNILKNNPILEKFIPKVNINGSVEGSKTNRVIDNVKVISTHSTILKPIYKKAKEIKKLEEQNVGNLIKIKDVSLEVTNEDEILGAKALLSGIMSDIEINDMGNVNLTTLLEVMYKDYSYILNGSLPIKRFKNNKNEQILIKIPMKAEGEMENQYSLADLEIGKVTIIGVYRGCFEKNELLNKLNKFGTQADSSKHNSQSNNDIKFESEDGQVDDSKVHFIDTISIVQDLNI